jgi:hypothetical protein
MNYPVPQEEEYYLFDHKIKKEKWVSKKKKKKIKGTLQKEYKKFISKNLKTLSSIPFIENIYLCNSITFNGLKEWSDIDLVIIASTWKIWTVKFFTTIYLFLKWLRRHGKKTRKKFCTSFYLTPEALNLFPLKLQNNTDIYLIYWLAHLVSLYSRDKNEVDRLIKHNNWIQNFLPNHPLEQTVNLWIKPQTGTLWQKKKIERILDWFIWYIVERTVKYTWLPIVLWKKAKHSKNTNIIISDTILKFYNDQRTKIQFLFDLNKTN